MNGKVTEMRPQTPSNHRVTDLEETAVSAPVCCSAATRDGASGERVEKVNEEGACSGCEALVARIRDRIERGRLPKIAGQEGKTPRTTALKLTQGDMPCAACDETIAAEHFAYPDYPAP